MATVKTIGPKVSYNNTATKVSRINLHLSKNRVKEQSEILDKLIHLSEKGVKFKSDNDLLITEFDYEQIKNQN